MKAFGTCSLRQSNEWIVHLQINILYGRNRFSKQFMIRFQPIAELPNHSFESMLHTLALQDPIHEGLYLLTCWNSPFEGENIPPESWVMAMKT